MADRTITSKAGLAKRGVPAPEIVGGDLDICITPPTRVRWTGTRAQLEAEGIVPGDAEWDRYGGQEWTDGDYALTLRHWVQQVGKKRTRAERLAADWWRLERRDRRFDKQGCWPESIYENREEYKRLLVGLEVCMGKRNDDWGKWWKATKDKAFQHMLEIALNATPCPDATFASVDDTRAKQGAVIAKLRAESRRRAGPDAEAA